MRHDIKGIMAIGGDRGLLEPERPFIKLVDWPPVTIAGARSLIAALFILAVVRRPKLNFGRDQIIAAVAYSFTMLLFVYANKNTTSANAILLQYGAPVYVMILSGAMLGERPCRSR